MTEPVGVLVDCLGLRGDFRSLIHTVLTRAQKQYTRPSLAAAIIDWVVREDLPWVLDSRGQADISARLRALPALSPSDPAARKDARVAARQLLAKVREGDPPTDPVAAKASLRAEGCLSYDDLLPVGNNLRHYFGWLRSEAADASATLRFIASLAGGATQKKSSVLIALATGEAAALWVTLREGEQGLVAENVGSLRERLPPEVARELG